MTPSKAAWVVGIACAILATVLLWEPIAGVIFVVGIKAWANAIYMLYVYMNCAAVGLAVGLFVMVRQVDPETKKLEDEVKRMEKELHDEQYGF